MEWSKLSMPERAEYIRLGVRSGITNIDSIRKIYNEYAEGGDKSDGITILDRIREAINIAGVMVNPLMILNPSSRKDLSNVILRNTEGQGNGWDILSEITGPVRPKYYDGNVHMETNPDSFWANILTTYNYSKSSPIELYTKGNFSKETSSPYGKGRYKNHNRFGGLDAYIGNFYGDTIYMHPNEKPYIDNFLNKSINVDKDSIMTGANMQYLDGTVDAGHHYITPEKDENGLYSLFMEDVWDTTKFIDLFNYPYIYNQKVPIKFTEEKDKLKRVPRLSSLYSDEYNKLNN